MAGPIGAMDGFARVLAAAAVWAALLVFDGARARPWLGASAMAAGTLLGLGFAEYALCAFPLLLVVGLLRPTRPRYGATALSLALMLAVFGAYMLARKMAVPTSVDAQRLTFSPFTWMVNGTKLGAAVLFPWDTSWVFTHSGLAATVVLGAGVGIVVIYIIGGLRPRDGRAWAGPNAPASVQSLVLAALCVGSTFPMVILGHVSELYTPQVVLPVALMLCAVTLGWQTRSHVLLPIAAGAVALLRSANAIQAKLRGMVDAGQRAEVSGNAIVR